MLGLPNRSYACSIKYGSNQINLPQYARENVEVRKMGQGTTVITNDSKKKSITHIRIIHQTASLKARDSMPV